MVCLDCLELGQMYPGLCKVEDTPLTLTLTLTLTRTLTRTLTLTQTLNPNPHPHPHPHPTGEHGESRCRAEVRRAGADPQVVLHVP